MKTDYDALLVVSFGGPEGMDDVIPFLENVLRGTECAARANASGRAALRDVWRRQSDQSTESKSDCGARKRVGAEWATSSDLLGQSQLASAASRHACSHGRRTEFENALAFVTSAYSSYSSCRQYRQNISDAQAEVGPGAPRVEKLRVFYNHPLFIEANVDHIRAALAQLEDAASAHLVFTAHSIPESMAANCDYAAQLAEAEV